MTLKTKSFKRHLTQIASNIDKHEVLMISGSIAYTTALALAPFMLILLSILSLLGPDLQDKLFDQITMAMGDKASKAIIEVVKNAHDRPVLSGISGIIGFLVLCLSASAIFTQLRVALDKINEFVLPTNKSGFLGFIKDKFFSVGLVLGFIFLSIVSLVFSTTLAAFFPQGHEGFFWAIGSVMINLLLFSILFTFIYRFIPSGKNDWRRCRISGLVSAVFYLVGKNLIGLYLGKAGLESSYGAAGSFIVFLAWVYYTAVTLLVSYEFSNNVVDPKHKWSKVFLRPL